MKLKFINIIFIFLLFTNCIGTSSQGVFGTGVSIAFDPRSIGTQIDDSIMQKNLSTRLALKEKSYILSISNKVLDGRIFLTDLTPLVSQASLVIWSFSSGLLTFPVKNILPSKTLVLIDSM